MDIKALVDFCHYKGLEISPSQEEQFIRFEEDLYIVNEEINLTRVEREYMVSRHFIDSLMIVSLLPLYQKVLDIGTGAGFPAWPIACLRPDLEITALDSNEKAIDFLKRHPLKNLKAVHDRAETSLLREQFDIVTGRAVAPISIQLEISVALCRIGGYLIPFRTPKDLEEIERIPVDKLGLELERVHKEFIPNTDVERVYPIYKKVRATSIRYPRSWSSIKKSPL